MWNQYNTLESGKGWAGSTHYNTYYSGMNPWHMIGSGDQIQIDSWKKPKPRLSSAAIHDGTDTEYLRGKFCIIDIDYHEAGMTAQLNL